MTRRTLANLVTYLFADNDQLLPITDDQQSGWKKSVVDLYTRGGKLWGVPQLWDAIALYNKDWSPGPASTRPRSPGTPPAPATPSFRPRAS